MAHADWSDVVRGAGILIVAIDLSVITMFVLDWRRGDTSEWQSPDDDED